MKSQIPMKDLTPIKITVEGGIDSVDKTLQLTIPPCANIEDWITVFKTILIHKDFSEILVKELFEEPDYTQEYEL